MALQEQENPYGQSYCRRGRCPLYAMSGSDFVQMYVGVGASRIRSLFNKAKKHERAVIFIDEIDAIGKKELVIALPAMTKETRP